ncbi:ABC transporter ATP-binding protein [Paraclostridium ghonii]|uniref:ABC-2 type transport system ATP-binding protein n=1 Tax=Paraclostridium ghonii TaxID=29358 RepID=A0ABU0MYI0_9FIRM|nr:ABC transporter ATP-binding protein [Paeniclostridium ghonii]MDQ0555977.1 ABC-2 type transport system ATP-binding protein [Paeniclostridium ghonii]
MSELEVLKLENISKSYSKKEVLKDISFSANPGEILGIVGPNGAGKTTIMKIISGLTKKYTGNVYINGENIRKSTKNSTKQIGCVIEAPGFYPDLTGYENLLFFAKISGLKDKSEINQISKILELDNYLNTKAKKYSLGLKQRLGVAQAVLTSPKILILDEPTNGLDPEIVPQIRNFIKKIALEKNMVVIISSHILSEIESICNKVLFMQKGEIIKIEDLTNSDDNKSVIAFETSMVEELESFLATKEILHEIINDNTVYVNYPYENLETLISQIYENKIRFKSVYKAKLSLESKYLKIMEESKNEINN